MEETGQGDAERAPGGDRELLFYQRLRLAREGSRGELVYDSIPKVLREAVLIDCLRRSRGSLDALRGLLEVDPILEAHFGASQGGRK